LKEALGLALFVTKWDEMRLLLNKR
jgi:hypothetical protein